MKRTYMILTSVSLLCVSTAYAQTKSADEELINSFRQNFMNSCLESGKDEKHKTTCNCVLNSVLKNFTPSELKNDAEVTKYVQNVALINCEGQ